MKSVVWSSLLLLAVTLTCIVFPGQYLEAQSVPPKVSAQLWARATPPGGSSGAIYGRIINEGSAPLTLNTIKFSAARHVMVHETILEDGMMKMKHADVVIEPGQAIDLVPGGRHIMLMGLVTPLKEGCRYQIEIVFDDGPGTTHDVATGGFGQSVAPTGKSETCL